MAVRELLPAYESLRRHGMGRCGLAQLASQTVAVPFVGLTAGCLVISELLRRLHGGQAVEVLSLSMLSPDDIEVVAVSSPPYAFGHLPTESAPAPAPSPPVFPDHVRPGVSA